MLMPAFDSTILAQRLMKMDSHRQLAFGASCCERLLPNYQMFHLETGYGGVQPLKDALGYAWIRTSETRGEYANEAHAANDKIYLLIRACENAAPQTEDFTSLYVTAAQDACFAICCCLDFLLDSDVEKITQVAAYATDSVDLYIQEIEALQPHDPNLEEKILSHFLMQRELLRQEEALRILESSAFLKVEARQQLSTTWDEDFSGNLACH